MSHTIVLVQPTNSKASRTFSDYESVSQAMDGVCAMFEKRLKELNPQMRQITYDINDLYRYIDTLHDLSALVFAPGALPVQLLWRVRDWSRHPNWVPRERLRRALRSSGVTSPRARTLQRVSRALALATCARSTCACFSCFGAVASRAEPDASGVVC